MHEQAFVALVSAITVFLVTIAGWWKVHDLTSKRDLENERRKMVVAFLLEAYRNLESVCQKGNVDADEVRWEKFVSALNDIQLLGSARQAALAKEVATGVATRRQAKPGDLLRDLRDSLREELKLEPIDDDTFVIRRAADDDSAVQRQSSIPGGKQHQP